MSAYQHAKRYKQIIEVLIKYGFGYLVDRIGVAIPRGIMTKDISGRPDAPTTPKRVVMMLEELGPTFVKFGQLLSTRPDIIPSAYIFELKQLQDDVEGISFKQVKEQVEKELKSKLEDLFLEFDPEPLAAASLSQVHNAVIPGDQKVVVKVQRPHIERIIRTDLEILMNIVRLAERRIPESRVYEPVAKLEELTDAMIRELDFTEEGWNIEKFRGNFEGDDTIYVPRVFDELTTKKVITMEYIEGKKVSGLPVLPKEPRQRAAKRIAEAMMKQVFVHGFFHGDPHPGNILIKKDGRISFIDFGLMGRIDGFIKGKLAQIIVGIIRQEPGRVSGAILDIGKRSEEQNKAKFEMDIGDLLEKYYDKTLKQIKIAAMLSEVFVLVARYKIMLPPEFTLLLKSIITVEGVGRELDDDFNVFETAKPFAQKLLHEYYGPRGVIKSSVKGIEDLTAALTLAPDIVEGIYKRLKADSVKLEFGPPGLEKMICEVHSMVNRIVLAFIISSVIIGSSIVILANKGPFLLNQPILGILGFTAAGVLGIGIVISILKSGKV